MSRDTDIALASRYEREADDDEQRAKETETSIPSYSRETQELCRDYVSARRGAASLARKLATLHRERTQQD